MANTQRLALLTKLQKVVKQQFKPVVADKQRSLLEHMLFAACLENSHHTPAEAAYQRLKERFFDWNEVRVSTVTELAEVLQDLYDASAAAARVKRVLQGTFETTYSFDLEVMKKQNLGVSMKQMEKLTDPNSFVMSYAVQHGLGGHAIPLDRGAWEVFVITGIATAQEAAAGHLTGLERIIPKNKGHEFASLLHQLGAEYLANTHSPNTKKVLQSINAQSVFPKRGESSLTIPPPPAPPPVEKVEKPAAKGADKNAGKGKPDPKTDAKVDKSKAGKAPAKVEAKSKEKEKSKASAKPSKPAAKKPAPAKGKPVAAKKSSSKQLAKRKPR